ncbi:hypothetical protein HDU76_008587, partial [Blyttiomyces sp. JEL0837]
AVKYYVSVFYTGENSQHSQSPSSTSSTSSSSETSKRSNKENVVEVGKELSPMVHLPHPRTGEDMYFLIDLHRQHLLEVQRVDAVTKERGGAADYGRSWFIGNYVQHEDAPGMFFYRLNEEKALNWLQAKATRLLNNFDNYKIFELPSQRAMQISEAEKLEYKKTMVYQFIADVLPKSWQEKLKVAMGINMSSNQVGVPIGASYMQEDSTKRVDAKSAGGGGAGDLKDAKKKGGAGGAAGKAGGKGGQSVGVKKLAGVSTRGMSQLTSFFGKKKQQQPQQKSTASASASASTTTTNNDSDIQSRFISLLPKSGPLADMKDLLSSLIADCKSADAIRSETNAFLEEELSVEEVDALFKKLEMGGGGAGTNAGGTVGSGGLKTAESRDSVDGEANVEEGKSKVAGSSAATKTKSAGRTGRTKTV